MRPSGITMCSITANWLENKENEAFKAAYSKMFPGERSDESVVLGYEVGTMMVKGLDEAGGNAEDTEKIINGIEKVDYLSPRGRIKMDPNHVANVPIYIFQVQKRTENFPYSVAAKRAIGERLIRDRMLRAASARCLNRQEAAWTFLSY